MNEAAIATFKVGEKYETRSHGDYDCIFRFEVVARTAKFVTFAQYGKTFRVGIKIHDGYEYVLPYGAYSLAPILCAGAKLVAA